MRASGIEASVRKNPARKQSQLIRLIAFQAVPGEAV